jgi:hypothetical protein
LCPAALASGDEAFDISVTIWQRPSDSSVAYRLGSRETKELKELARWFSEAKGIANESGLAARATLHVRDVKARRPVIDVIARLAEAGFDNVEVRLPVSPHVLHVPQAVPEDVRDAPVVRIDANGTVLRGGDAISIDEFEKLVVCDRAAARKVVVKVDPGAHWRHVLWVVQSVGRHGVCEVDLETQVDGEDVVVPIRLPRAGGQNSPLVCSTSENARTRGPGEPVHVRVRHGENDTVLYFVDGLGAPDRETLRRWVAWARAVDGNGVPVDLDASAEVLVAEAVAVLLLMRDCLVADVGLSAPPPLDAAATGAKRLPPVR